MLRAVTVAAVVVLLIVGWVLAGCTVVMPGARAGLPESVTLRGPVPEPSTFTVSYPEPGVFHAGSADAARGGRVRTGRSRRVRDLLERQPRMPQARHGAGSAREDRIEMTVEEATPVALTVSCSAEGVRYAVAASLPRPVDPASPPPVFDGIGPRPLPLDTVP